jgi:hypothetical protein
MVMSESPQAVRQVILPLLVLTAVVHANLAADLSGRAPNTSGITRLSRDLLRKPGDDCFGCRIEAALPATLDL